MSLHITSAEAEWQHKVLHFQAADTEYDFFGGEGFTELSKPLGPILFIFTVDDLLSYVEWTC